MLCYTIGDAFVLYNLPLMFVSGTFVWPDGHWQILYWFILCIIVSFLQFQQTNAHSSRLIHKSIFKTLIKTLKNSQKYCYEFNDSYVHLLVEMWGWGGEELLHSHLGRAITINWAGNCMNSFPESCVRWNWSDWIMEDWNMSTWSHWYLIRCISQQRQPKDLSKIRWIPKMWQRPWLHPLLNP